VQVTVLRHLPCLTGCHSDVLLLAADVVPVGLDGRKMSKSYGNVVPIFAEPDELRRLVGLLDAAFGTARVAYGALMADPAEPEQLLAAGTERARERAGPMINRVRAAVGLG
jgi:tryptophanyl-tRNA synthetase